MHPSKFLPVLFGSLLLSAAGQDEAQKTEKPAPEQLNCVVSFSFDGKPVELLLSGHRIEAILDGQRVDAANIKRTGETALIRFDRDGDGFGDVEVNVDYSPDLARFDEKQEDKLAIGVQVDMVGEALAAQLGLESAGSGLLILEVEEGMPADAAGLQAHDVVVGIGGEKPVNFDLLRETLTSMHPGTTLEVEVLRRGDPLQIKIEPVLTDAAVSRITLAAQRVLLLQRPRFELLTIQPEPITRLANVRLFTNLARERLQIPLLATARETVALEMQEQGEEKEQDPEDDSTQQTVLERLDRLEAYLARIEKLLEDRTPEK